MFDESLMRIIFYFLLIGWKMREYILPVLILLVILCLYYSYVYLKKALDHLKATYKGNIVLDKEYYLQIKLKLIKNALLQKNEKEKDDFLKLYHSLETVMDQKYHSIFNKINDSFDNFNIEEQNSSENNVTFLENIKILLEKANFHPITDKEVDFHFSQFSYLLENKKVLD